MIVVSFTLAEAPTVSVFAGEDRRKTAHMMWFPGASRSSSMIYWLLFALVPIVMLWAGSFAISLHAYEVFPTVGTQDEMLDKTNFPFVAQYADGFKFMPTGLEPFPKSRLDRLINQFTNKRVMFEAVYKGGDRHAAFMHAYLATAKRLPAGAEVAAYMLYSESGEANATAWKLIMNEKLPFPVITHVRSFKNNGDADFRKRLALADGVMFESPALAENDEKFSQTADLIRYCVDHDKMVVLLTAYKYSPSYNLVSYQNFFYYLKRHLESKYMESEKLIFAPSAYDDDNILPESNGGGGTFAVAKWLIEQRTSPNPFPPAITFTSVHDNNYFAYGTNLTVELKVEHEVQISDVKLFKNDMLVGEVRAAPFRWSGGILDQLESGYHELRAVATDLKGLVGSKVIRISVLKEAQPIPGKILAGDMSSYTFRSPPVNGRIPNIYMGEEANYQINVTEAGKYDLEFDLYIQRTKMYGGTVILLKGDQELGRFTTILHNPAEKALPGFTERPAPVIKGIPLAAGVQTLTLHFDRPDGKKCSQFALDALTFRFSAPSTK